MHPMHGEGLGLLDFSSVAIWTKNCSGSQRHYTCLIPISIWIGFYPGGQTNQCCMSVDLVAFGWRFFVTNPNYVVLSVCIGVGGCLWPISSTAVRTGIACRELIHSAPISASAAKIITFIIICAMFNNAPLFAGFVVLSYMKKFPPAVLLDFGLVR